jgi:hypothetical protein
MSKPKTVLGLLSAFLIGCVASQMTAFVVPPARAGTSPQKWEYACVGVGSDEEADTVKANEFGRSGWEMSGSLAHYGGGGTWCFKRPCPEGSLSSAIRTRAGEQVHEARALPRRRCA